MSKGAGSRRWQLPPRLVIGLAATVGLWPCGPALSAPGSKGSDSVSGFGFPFSAALVDPATWDSEDFLEDWWPAKVETTIAHRIWPRPTEVFGRRPHVISARFERDSIRSITLLFLDSGTHFGYVPKERAVSTEREHREAFHELYQSTLGDVRDSLQALSGSPTRSVQFGSGDLLRQQVELFACGQVTARLHAIDDQLVKLTLFRNADDAASWLHPDRRRLNIDEWSKRLADRVRIEPNGDRLLDDVPMFPQGDRAYCGVSALTMAMQYLGLDVDTEDYAAAAGIRYGSTRGSRIREVYSAAGDEAGFTLRRSTDFDFEQCAQSIDAGIPVVVWRRWSQQRDYLHTQFARRFAGDPAIELPAPDAGDRELWPDEEAYNHASVITGYNAERGEVIFTESWGEAVRNRRMRVEEMQATSYYSFHFLP